MHHGGLENNEGSGKVVLDLDLHRVGLVDGNDGDGEEIRRPDEEVSVEGLHSQTCSKAKRKEEESRQRMISRQRRSRRTRRSSLEVTLSSLWSIRYMYLR